MSAPTVGEALQPPETVLHFETCFLDNHTNHRYTVTFRFGEPVLYHPPHLAKPVLTHISFVGNGFFVVGASTTDRMIPNAMAQNVLHMKLSLEDVEREVQGVGLDVGERVFWRRWLDTENLRSYRKSRVQAPCCGRYKFRYQLEQDTDGTFYCDACWNAEPNPAATVARPPPTQIPSPQEQQQPRAEERPGDVAAGQGKAVTLVPGKDAPWRNPDAPSPKRRRHSQELTVEYWNDGGAFGYAHCADDSRERVLLHGKDCNFEPRVGDCVSAFVHRRRKDGKLQAFKVVKTWTEEERVHATLLGSS